MKEKGQDRIQKICDELRKETIEPAKKDAEKIIEDANLKSDQIIQETQKKADKLLTDARQNIEQERNVFNSSLEQASKQALETLKQSIENKLFNEHLDAILSKQVQDPQVISKLINAIVETIKAHGISADFSAIVPSKVSDKEINSLLMHDILNSLKEKSVKAGMINGGTQIKLNDKNLTIDMSDEAIKELLSNHIRKGFRKLLFGTEK